MAPPPAHDPFSVPHPQDNDAAVANGGKAALEESLASTQSPPATPSEQAEVNKNVIYQSVCVCVRVCVCVHVRACVWCVCGCGCGCVDI